MNAAHDVPTPSLGSWLRATWIGWVLGIPITAGLALAGEGFGVGGVQVLVGAGVGAGVGLLQGRLVRRLRVNAAAWVASCVVGLAIPFLIWDIAAALDAGWRYDLVTCVALGGVLVGLWQAALLRRRLSGAWWWVAGSAVGWALAGGTATLSDRLLKSRSLHGLAGAGAYLGLIVLGGGILGLATGVVLVRRWRPAQD